VSQNEHSPETPGQQLAAQLARSEQRRKIYEAALSSTPDLVYVFDLNHRFLYANEALLAMWGRTWEEAIGKNCLELGYPDWHADMHGREIEQVIATHKPIKGVVPFEGTNGRRMYEYIFVPVFSSNGEVELVAGTTRDVTDRERDEEKRRQFLSDLDQAIRPLVDPTEITAVSASLLGEHLKVDRCAYADVEADQDTFNLLGDYNRDVPSIVGRYTFTQFGLEVLRLMRANQPYVVADINHHIPRPEDREAYRQTMIQAVICVPLHKAGRFVAAMAVHQKSPRVWKPDEVELVLQVAARCWESIERTRVTRDLKQSEERFRQLANTIPQLAWMAKPDGWIFWYNERWYEYTGTTLEQMQGWGWEQVHDPVELQRMLLGWKQALATGEPWEDVFPLRRHDGEFRWHLSRARPLRDSDGQILLWFGTNTDVTEQRRLSEEREALLAGERAARAEAERISQMKDEFLATLSHELRTPLNAILGYATLMRVAELSGADLEEAVTTIERNARLQAQLIEDLLDMNRIISGKIRLDVQPVNLIDVLDEAIAAVMPSAEAKGITLMRIVQPDVGTVRGDPSRLQQVVWNLLTNAIKFTPNGGHVHLSLERTESQIEITVSDTGQGIASDFLPHVFDRFRQADSSTTRRHGGLGLGLSIVRQLVELHGGVITVTSAGPGLGATFMVTLPISSALEQSSDDKVVTSRPDDAQEKSSVSRLRGVRVLVVDDEPDATALVKRVLERCEAEVERAGSVAEAMELLSVHNFDIIVSDIGMPGEDGYQFIRRVRSLQNPHRNVPAVALTAFARAEDRRKAALAGFQTHLSKPVEAAELVAIVANLARRDSLA